MIDTARKHGAGVFVLALTSNKEGPEVQEARAGDRAVADVVLGRLRDLNHGADPLGSFGAVIGATIEGGRDFDFDGPILAPGFGAQGGTVDDLRRIFGRAVGHVLPEHVARPPACGSGRAGGGRRPAERAAARLAG